MTTKGQAYLICQRLHLERDGRPDTGKFFDLEPDHLLQQSNPAFYADNEFKFTDPKHGLQWLQAMHRDNIVALKKLTFFVNALYIDIRPTQSDMALAPPSVRKYMGIFGVRRDDEKTPDTLWCEILDVLGTRALGLEKLSIYWDAEWGDVDKLDRLGGGVDIAFLQALCRIQSLKVLDIRGFYAKEWPAYLQGRLGELTVVQNSELKNSEKSRKMLGSFQSYLKDLDPYLDS